MALAPGTRLGPYEIVTQLGAGGMGEVYRARDCRLDRTVAIKVGSEQFIRRFEQEARAIAALSHPHICALYDIGPDYLVMEYIDGSPLKGPLPVEQAVPLAVQIASALAEAHRKGIVHRDLKPANILVTSSGVKLLDFGLAKRDTDADITRTAVGEVVGTAAYMSPEQAEGLAVDTRSDIFSFGLVLYEMLSGERAFPGETALSLMLAIVHRDPRPLQAPPELERIVSRCLSKSPADRFQTMEEVKAALEDAAISKSGEPAPSIAVLPFANMSPDKDNEYFAEGLSEEIINALTRVPRLKVTARTSAFSFRGKDATVAEIGRQLGVAHVLEGSVRKAGNRIRVTAQLVKAADGFHLWSERYDREMTDVFAIQDEIAASITEELRSSLTGPRPAEQPATNVAAYEAYLEGNHHWYRFTPSSTAQALACFERAVAIDPSFALAHAGLADYYFVIGAMGLAEPAAVFRRAATEAARAVQLDPARAEAHSTQAMILALLDYDWPASERAFRRALELNPGSSHVRFPYAFWYLRTHGRLEEAMAEMNRVLEHDPLSPAYHFGKVSLLLLQRRFEAAEEASRRILEIDPTYGLGLIGLANALGARGHFDQALGVAEKLVAMQGGWAIPIQTMAELHAMAGNTAEARRFLEQLQELARHSYVGADGFAMIYALLGDFDNAFAWMNKAVDCRDPGILILKTRFVFDGLRQDSRYAALLRRVNLA